MSSVTGLELLPTPPHQGHIVWFLKGTGPPALYMFDDLRCLGLYMQFGHEAFFVTGYISSQLCPVGPSSRASATNSLS